MAGIAAVQGTTSVVRSLLSLNHPYGTCAPNAPDMMSFLSCWKHPIPDNFMPIWTDIWGGTDGRGWLFCFGAKNGVPPAEGCAEYGPSGNSRCVNGVVINPKTGTQITGVNGSPGCAPVGAVQSVKGGGFILSPSAQSLASKLAGSTAGKAGLAALAGVAVLGAFFLAK